MALPSKLCSRGRLILKFQHNPRKLIFKKCLPNSKNISPSFNTIIGHHAIRIPLIQYRVMINVRNRYYLVDVPHAIEQSSHLSRNTQNLVNHLKIFNSRHKNVHGPDQKPNGLLIFLVEHLISCITGNNNVATKITIRLRKLMNPWLSYTPPSTSLGSNLPRCDSIIN